MSQELIYTSAPRGLRPGNQGFCTVAATQGMSALLMERLEGLSMYPRDAAAVGAVVQSHFRVSVGGKVLHILSRIRYVEQEYTGRTNHLAHHLVLEPQQLPPGGPAWLLNQKELWYSSWEAEPKWLASGKLLPAGGPASGPCRRWQELMGDAGWGGALVDAFVQAPAMPAYVIFDRGQDILPMLGEVVALLPPGERWGVTFTTFFYPQLGPESPCLWRGVLRGSAAEKPARRGGLILDLAKPQGEPPTSPWVTAARTGQRPGPLESVAVGAAPLVRAPGNVRSPSPRAVVTSAASRRDEAALLGSAASNLRPMRVQGRWLRILVSFAAGVAVTLLFGGVFGMAILNQPGKNREENLLKGQDVNNAVDPTLHKHREAMRAIQKDLLVAQEAVLKAQDEKKAQIDKVDKQRETIVAMQGDLRKARNERDKLNDNLQKEKSRSEELTIKHKIAESDLHSFLGGVARAKGRPEGKEAKKYFDKIASDDKAVVFLDLENVLDIQIKGEAQKWWTKVKDKHQIEARDPLEEPKNVVPRKPICSIEHGKVGPGKIWLELRWHTTGDKKAELSKLLYRSILTVKAANDKPIYVSFWQPRPRSLLPHGFEWKDVFYVLSPIREHNNDSKTVNVVYYYTVVGDIRVKLFQANMDQMIREFFSAH